MDPIKAADRVASRCLEGSDEKDLGGACPACGWAAVQLGPPHQKLLKGGCGLGLAAREPSALPSAVNLNLAAGWGPWPGPGREAQWWVVREVQDRDWGSAGRPEPPPVGRAGWGRPSVGEPACWPAPQPVPASLISGRAGPEGPLCGEVPSELPANGLGHPALLPGGRTRLGLFPGSPLSPTPRPPAQAWPAGLPLASPCGWPGGWSCPGLLTHQLRSVGQALGKEAHLGLCHPSGRGVAASAMAQAPGYRAYSSPEAAAKARDPEGSWSPAARQPSARVASPPSCPWKGQQWTPPQASSFSEPSGMQGLGTEAGVSPAPSSRRGSRDC